MSKTEHRKMKPEALNGTTGQKRKRDEVKKNAIPVKKRKTHLDAQRQALPIWPRAKEIRQSLKNHDVLVLTGETGSGKSTQVPQFLLDSPWCTGTIAVTQPRRVAATNLARRVAEEMATPLGRSSPASKVGYSVRFDDNTSPSTRIKFLTEGMLLQEMLRDPALGGYDCVIVDEVHERSVDVDLILGFLKGLLENETKRKGRTLKVVVMSATADVEGLMRFFERQGDEGSDVKDGGVEAAVENGSESKVSRCHVEGRQYPVKTHYLDAPAPDYLDTALHRIFQIHCKEPMPGDILVFLDGAEAIKSLQKSVEEFAGHLTNDFPKMLVLPLYAKLPQYAQQQIFERAPPNTRKVILSTNIAETSVTVPGVRFVVDSGRFKMKQFRSKLGLESLLAKPISKSSAEQRKGRAGREAAGQCYRLYTESTYKDLEKDTKPEILHCDLSNAILKMKARGVDDILNFPFLTAPPLEALQRSLNQLVNLSCLEAQTGTITPLGQKVARLPLPPQLGVVLIESSKPSRSCLNEVIDIVSCLSVEDIWLPTHNDSSANEAVIEARSQLQRREGDLLTLLAAVQAYTNEESDRKTWCKKHAISHSAMRSVMDVRKQLRQQTQSLQSTSQTDPPNAHHAAESSSPSEVLKDNIIKSFLLGFKTNIAILCPDKSYKTAFSRQVVSIHPSSVLADRDRNKKMEGIVFCDFVFTQKAYARNVSAIQLQWLDEL
ncbi:putative ATP-dependent RNA helicase prh1 [Pseudocercospora fuligena]|uniref:RNA helicase n=1 Tax=Pseudocercospora fuligena TaxID=685502 RepID=A0A8H6RII7_9PEZI|nr:putative ATP-dependent RNA helicase prh1 [Pseudocercospora fuligena]